MQELLESNNIYSEDLTINSETLLEFAEKLNDRVAIINGNVVIEYGPDLDNARLQAVVSKMKTIVGDLHVRASSNSVTPLNFDSITGVQNIIIAQPGSVSFSSLKGVTGLTIGNNYESKVTGALNFKALETVGTITQGEITTTFGTTSPIANSLVFTRATSINFDALKYYAPAALTLEGDEGFELAISSLQTNNADGEAVPYTLSVTGASMLKSSLLTEGTLTVKDVDTVVLDAFTGTVNIDEGVRDVTLGALSENLSLMGATSTAPKNDLEHIKITAKGKETSKTEYPAINLQYAASLLDATISGTAKSVNFMDDDDLETANLEADIETVTFSGNGNLVTLTATGKIKSLTINDCDDLETADLAYTNSDAAKGGTLVVTGNNNLTSFKADKVNNLNVLTIQSNSDLATISFDALKADATGTSTASVTIGGAPDTTGVKGNDFNATTITKTKTGGKFTSTSGLSDLKDFLTDAKAKNGAQIKVYFDSADTYNNNAVDPATSETNLVITDTADVDELTVANITETTTGAAVREVQSYVFPIRTNTLGTALPLESANGIQLVYSGTTKAWTSGVGGVSSIETLMTAINADTTFDPANIKITAAKDANKAKHIKIDFTKGGAVSTTTTAGVITFKFDKEYLTTATIAANSNQDAIATAVTATISATDKYNASATLNTIAINAAIASGSSSGDISPLAAAVPSDFSFVIDAAQTSTTVQFSTTTSNTAGLTANAFHLGSTSWDTVGLRVTIKNESTAVALGTVGLTAVGGAAATTAFANGAGQLLVPGTNMVAKSTSNEAKVEALVAAFSDISDPTTTGSTLNRITWL